MQLDVSRMSEEKLIAGIRECNERYWSSESDSALSDVEYDALLRELERRNPSHPLLSEVGTPGVSGTGEKVHHVQPMLSLDKAYSLEAVLSWARKFARSEEESLLVQPKYDGISALWENQILSTRGDGYDGENISNKVPLIELETIGLTAPLSAHPELHILGEIVIREDDFKTIYAKIRNRNGKPYKNSRNAVAGIMGLKEIGDMVTQGAKLSLIDYDLHSETLPLSRLESEWTRLEKTLRGLPYPMDGLVVKFADASYAASLGNTAHHPRGQIAYKFTAERHVSTLRNVIWSLGKNCLTPVAEFDPVDIGGATIRNASLHNIQNILDKDVHIGDIVEVERAGDVIPYIASVAPGEERRPCIIEVCPSCGEPLVRELPELCCVNPDCPERRVQLLLSAMRILEIEGMGEANVRSLIKIHNIRDLSQIFSLGELDLQRLPNFKATSARKIYRQIQHAKSAPDWQLLTALNIKGIGPNIAKAILARISFSDLRKADVETLSGIPGIGPERAGMIQRELQRQADVLDRLLAVRAQSGPDQDLFGF